jgi:hypothetical protein
MQFLSQMITTIKVFYWLQNFGYGIFIDQSFLYGLYVSIFKQGQPVH